MDRRRRRATTTNRDQMEEYLLFAYEMPTNNDDDDRCVCNGAMTCHTTRKSLSREVFFFVCFAFFSTFLNGSNINHTSLEPITACHSAVFVRYSVFEMRVAVSKTHFIFARALSLSPRLPLSRCHVLALHSFTRQVCNQSIGIFFGAFGARVFSIYLSLCVFEIAYLL